MPIFKLTLQKREQLYDNTHVFYFDKPKDFIFKPGQYGGFTLLSPIRTDDRGMTRRFSLLSPPNADTLSFATRIQPSAYKESLNAMKVGDEIKFAGPTGNFVLHDDIEVPAVLIAGGIGVTPFYCMIKHAEHHPTSQPLYLFYGNRSKKTALWLNELENICQQNRNLKMIPTMEDAEDWQGETGFINDALLKKHLPDLYAPIYYICGAPRMVTALQETIAELGVDESQIKVEDFPGY